MHPYAAPTPPHGPLPSPYAPPVALAPYVPLGWRSVAAQVGVGFAVMGSFATDFASLAVGHASEEDLGAALVQVGCGLLAILGTVTAAIFFCIWIHRAALNVRAFGATSLHYTPGWAVGYWFIPFANLYHPVRAFKEVWRASDPGAVTQSSTSWISASVPGLFTAWWALWIISNLLGNVSAKIPDEHASGAVGLVGSFLSVGGAILVSKLIRDLDRRQAECDRRLRAASGFPQPMP